ncbi:hypothetical protein BGX20_005580, partial [Mortierella sp. AD010]
MAGHPKPWCLEERNSTTFSVRYVPTDDIDALKSRIMPDVGPIGRSNVTLWKVEIPISKDAVYEQNYQKSVEKFKSDH